MKNHNVQAGHSLLNISASVLINGGKKLKPTHQNIILILQMWNTYTYSYLHFQITQNNSQLVTIFNS